MKLKDSLNHYGSFQKLNSFKKGNPNLARQFEDQWWKWKKHLWSHRSQEQSFHQLSEPSHISWGEKHRLSLSDAGSMVSKKSWESSTVCRPTQLKVVFPYDLVSVWSPSRSRCFLLPSTDGSILTEDKAGLRQDGLSTSAAFSSDFTQLTQQPSAMFKSNQFGHAHFDRCDHKNHCTSNSTSAR